MAKETTPLTIWSAFEKAGLFPIEVTCDGYLPVHTRNNGCHTRLAVRKRDEAGNPVDTAEGMINHVRQQHGSREYGTGFLLKFKRTENKTWAGWRQLAEAKMEITDCRCDHCGSTVEVKPADLLWHLKPHGGKVKKSTIKNLFWISIREDSPVVLVDDNLFDDVD